MGSAWTFGMAINYEKNVNLLAYLEFVCVCVCVCVLVVCMYLYMCIYVCKYYNTLITHLLIKMGAYSCISKLTF